MNTLFHRTRFRSSGAAMLMVLAFTIIGGIAITAWTYLLAARAIQASRMGDSVARHITWGNTAAINQQYNYEFAYRDNVTQPELTTTVNGGGGEIAAAYFNIRAFKSTNNYSNPSAVATPFNNIRKQITPDSSVYYTRTNGASDTSQTEHLLYYNFQKTYPRSLLGDLLIVHAKPSGAGNTYISDNIKVNGRVVVYDSSADISGVQANECLNLTKTGTNTTLDSSGAASLLPQNFSARPIFTAGSTGGSTGADLSGALNMCNNANFTPGSIWHIMSAASPGYYTLSSSSTSSTLASGANIDSNADGGATGTTKNSGSATSDIWVKTGGSAPIQSLDPPTTSPYNYTWGKSGSAVALLLKSSTLYHVDLKSGATQLILQGQTNAADYTAASTLPPVIVLVEQEIRDIRFVGENSRPLILAVGTGTGATCFMGWSGSSTASGGGPLRWRLHLVNQYRTLYLDAPSGNNVTITGGIRTNSSIYSTDTTATDRFFINTESSPGNLTTLLPRDGWFEPLIVQ
jgi:hypothetical protein